MPQASQSFPKASQPLIFSLCTLAFFLVLVFLRLHNLSADPPPWKRLGDVFDEGHWVSNPRNFVLFGQWMVDDQNTWTGSPLMAFFWLISFKFFGVSFFSARLVSAIFGFLTILLVYWSLWKLYGYRMAFMGLLFLGLNATYLMYNRLAIIESSISFFIMLSLVCWFLGKQYRPFYFWAGIAFALACLAKIFNIIYLCSFALIWLWENFRHLREKRIRESFSGPVLGIIGFLIIFIPYYFFVYKTHYDVYNVWYAVLNFNAIKFGSIKDFLHIFLLGLSQTPAEQIFDNSPISLLVAFLVIAFFSVLAKPGLKLSELLSKIDRPMGYLLIFLISGWMCSIPLGFIDRRQVIFMVPWIILAARIVYLILFENFGTDQKRKKRISSSQLTLVLMALFYAVWSFIHVVWRKYRVIDFPMDNKYLAFLILGFLIGGIVGVLWFISRRNVRLRSLILEGCCFFSAFLLALLPLSVSLIRWSEIFNGVEFFSSQASLAKIYKGLLCVLLIVVGTALLRRNFKLDPFINKRAAIVFVLFLLAYNIFEIYVSVFRAPQSLYKASQYLGTILPKGTLVNGVFSQEMAFENETYGFARYQYDEAKYANDRRDTAFYLVSANFKTDEEKRTLLTGEESRVTTLKILPSLFRKDHYRMTLELYAVPGNAVYNTVMNSQFTSNTAFEVTR